MTISCLGKHTNNIPEITTIFQTGDDCSHKDITQTPSYNLKTIKYVNDRLQYYFPNISITNIKMI